MKAEVIAIGTELLLGDIVNTNTTYLARKLAELGIDHFYQTTVGDNPSRLLESLIRSFNRAEVVITTGGLGPTVDDITCETVAKLFGRGLVFNRSILKEIKEHFRGRNIKAPPDNVRQAYIPRGAKWLRNRLGTAPGLIIEEEGKAIIALPGPPRELQPMFEEAVIPYLKGRARSKWTIRSRVIRTTGSPESEINKKVRDLLRLGPNPTVGIYARLGEVDLKVTAKAKGERAALRLISKIEKEIRRRLGGSIFGYDGETLEAAVARALTRKGKTIAIAESCTGGLLSNRLTNISGSSKYFLMGLVAYSDKPKAEMLGVSGEILKRRGAVSREVALQMADGAKRIGGADIGIGITGIAGPTGATRSKPVGLVYIALAAGRRMVVREFHFKGSRDDVKLQTSQAALDMIRLSLSSERGEG